MSSNSFNICNRCGMSNPLLTKYCFQCGQPLRAAEESINCSKCSTVNVGSAKFCKTCGTLLPRPNETKTCPRCKIVVAKDLQVCVNCSYKFIDVTKSGASLAKKTQAEAVKEAKMYVAKQRLSDKKTKDKKGSRAVAAVEPCTKAGKAARILHSVMLFLTLAFTFLIFYPLPSKNSSMQLPLVFMNILGASGTNFIFYGWELIVCAIEKIGISLRPLYLGTPLVSKVELGSNASAVAGFALFAIAVVIVLNLVLTVIRLIKGEKYRRMDILGLVMFALSAVFCIMFYGASLFPFVADILSKIVSLNFELGILPLAVPVYFLLTWLVSLFFKEKRIRK